MDVIGDSAQERPGALREHVDHLVAGIGDVGQRAFVTSGDMKVARWAPRRGADGATPRPGDRRSDGVRPLREREDAGGGCRSNASNLGMANLPFVDGELRSARSSLRLQAVGDADGQCETGDELAQQAAAGIRQLIRVVRVHVGAIDRRRLCVQRDVDPVVAAFGICGPAFQPPPVQLPPEKPSMPYPWSEITRCPEYDLIPRESPARSLVDAGEGAGDG